MDTYKFISSDAKFITIDFFIDGKQLKKKFDIRYVPTYSAIQFKGFCEMYIQAYKDGLSIEKEDNLIVKEIADLVGVAIEAQAEEPVPEELTIEPIVEESVPEIDQTTIEEG